MSKTIDRSALIQMVAVGKSHMSDSEWQALCLKHFEDLSVESSAMVMNLSVRRFSELLQHAEQIMHMYLDVVFSKQETALFHSL